MTSNILEVKEALSQLDFQIELSYTQFRMFQRVLIKSMSLLRTMGLPEDVEQGIMALQRYLFAFRMLTAGIHGLEMAIGPLGWMNAILGLAVSATTLMDVVG